MTQSHGIRASAIDLTSVESADRSTLQTVWHQIHGTEPPKNLSLPFLRQALCHEVQCLTEGRLSGKFRRQIKQRLGQSNAASRGTKAVPLPVTTLQPGARLVRDWNGKTWVVDVTEHGFEMRGETYRSLTAIAKKITGTHWSGPRFFGLNAGSKTRPAGTLSGAA